MPDTSGGLTIIIFLAIAAIVITGWIFAAVDQTLPSVIAAVVLTFAAGVGLYFFGD